MFLNCHRDQTSQCLNNSCFNWQGKPIEYLELTYNRIKINSAWRSIKIVLFLALIMQHKLSFGTIQANSIWEDGKIVNLDKDKKQEKDYSIHLENISIGDSFLAERKMERELWNCLMITYMKDNGSMVSKMEEVSTLKLALAQPIVESGKMEKEMGMDYLNFLTISFIKALF